MGTESRTDVIDGRSGTGIRPAVQAQIDALKAETASSLAAAHTLQETTVALKVATAERKVREHFDNLDEGAGPGLDAFVADAVGDDTDPDGEDAKTAMDRRKRDAWKKGSKFDKSSGDQAATSSPTLSAAGYAKKWNAGEPAIAPAQGEKPNEEEDAKTAMDCRKRDAWKKGSKFDRGGSR